MIIVVAALCSYRPIVLLGDGWGRGTVNEEGGEFSDG